MTNFQLFLSLTGIILTTEIAALGFLKYYIDAKIEGVNNKFDTKLDAIGKNVDMLVQYMILHEGKITTLEERTKNL